ncbi:3-hydroxyacyl-ACP dehydratase FabZ family protein [Streptomyces sp. NPDC058623]|uniref:3-hydroxyacyl-ACP dehydratase FabZ family protein n=1 Tax=Streptomyces sp. NPDC058623 TaxID=3346563 RepID=UPI00365EEA18
MAAPAAGPVRAVPVVGRDSDGAPRTTVHVAADEQVFPGHYPGFPIFPGVCVVELVHRSALATAPESGARVTLQAIESTRFLSPVFPGDRLTIELKWARRGEHWRCDAVAGTDRGRAATVRLRFTEGSTPC